MARRFVDAGLVILTALAATSATALWLTEGAERVAGVAGESGFLLLRVVPKVVAGVLIAAALPALLPTERVRGWIGPDRGVAGLLLASGVGALAPGGPSLAIPLALGLVAAGADRGAAAAFLTGWMVLGVSRTVVWELSFLAPDLVGLRLLLSLPAPVLVGLAVRALDR